MIAPLAAWSDGAPAEEAGSGGAADFVATGVLDRSAGLSLCASEQPMKARVAVVERIEMALRACLRFIFRLSVFVAEAPARHLILV